MGGANGLKTSVLGIGCWQFGNASEEEYWGKEYTQKLVTELVVKASDCGVNYFDTAEAYFKGRSEVLLGKAIKELKEPVVISSKILPSNCTRQGVINSLTQTLNRLDVDCIDLYLVHWPIKEEDDEKGSPSVKAAFEALADMQKNKKIKHIGISNFGIKQMTEALETGVKIICNQLAYNLVFRAIEFEIIPFCKRHGISVVCYSPLLQGLLSGKFKRVEDVPEYRARTRHFSKERTAMNRHGTQGHEKLLFDTLGEIEKIANGAGISMVDLALSWPLSNPGVSCVVAGCSTASQMEANAMAVQTKLSADLLDRLDKATTDLKKAMGENADMWENSRKSRIR